MIERVKACKKRPAALLKRTPEEVFASIEVPIESLTCREHQPTALESDYLAKISTRLKCRSARYNHDGQTQPALHHPAILLRLRML